MRTWEMRYTFRFCNSFLSLKSINVWFVLNCRCLQDNDTTATRIRTDNIESLRRRLIVSESKVVKEKNNVRRGLEHIRRKDAQFLEMTKYYQEMAKELCTTLERYFENCLRVVSSYRSLTNAGLCSLCLEHHLFGKHNFKKWFCDGWLKKTFYFIFPISNKDAGRELIFIIFPDIILDMGKDIIIIYTLAYCYVVSHITTFYL